MAVIHVIDDDASLRAALTRLLRCSGYEVCGYASVGEFLVRTPQAGDGCILLDLVLGGPSGLELQQALLRDPQALPIVFMSGYNDVASAGAVDFLLKPFDRNALLQALQAALAPGATGTGTVTGAPPLSLSERELTVLRGVVSGLRNRDIALQLRLSERTIKSCRAHLMRRFGATSLAELIRRAGSLVDQASRQVAPPSETRASTPGILEQQRLSC
jgi:FixJ family two-component response regulator